MLATRGKYLDKRFGNERLALGPDECPRRFQRARDASESQVRTSVWSSSSEAAARANRAKAGSDPAPILFMTEAR